MRNMAITIVTVHEDGTASSVGWLLTPEDLNRIRALLERELGPPEGEAVMSVSAIAASAGGTVML